MINRIINITSTGGWNAVDLPWKTRLVSVQARTNVDCQVRFRTNEAETWTVKAGTVHTFTGSFNDTDMQIFAALGIIIEVEATNYGL